MKKEPDTLFIALELFCKILDVKGRSFGSNSTSYQGMSDGAEGVQWNIWADKSSNSYWLGVNLEGKKFKNWPIADFLITELQENSLVEIAKKIDSTEKIIVGLNRDAWQVTYRPPIVESRIGGEEVWLSDLNTEKWKDMLREALTCLNTEKGYRGRARQEVTLQSGVRKVMEVSPHLNVHTRLNIYETDSRSDIEETLNRGFSILSPIYKYIVSCIA